MFHIDMYDASDLDPRLSDEVEVPDALDAQAFVDVRVQAPLVARIGEPVAL